MVDGARVNLATLGPAARDKIIHALSGKGGAETAGRADAPAAAAPADGNDADPQTSADRVKNAHILAEAASNAMAAIAAVRAILAAPKPIRSPAEWVAEAEPLWNGWTEAERKIAKDSISNLFFKQPEGKRRNLRSVK